MQVTVRGTSIFVATGGVAFDPAKPSVMLIHGAGMDHTVWYLQARALAHHGRNVLAVDLPGHGRSDGEPLTSIGDLADWVRDFQDALGLAKAALVGHSMGALTALEAAARHPDRVEAIGLLGVAARMPVHPELLGAAKANDHLAFDLVNSWAHGRPAHVGGHAQPGLWMMGGALRLLERSRPGALHADLAACDAYQGAAVAAAKATCPALFVLGDIDQMSPAKKAAELAATMATARTVIIRDCGHMMMIEKPLDTTAALRGML